MAQTMRTKAAKPFSYLCLLTMMTDCSWVDRTGWTWLTVHGADRFDLLHRLSTNDLSSMPVGNGRQTVCLTDKARIVDVVTVLAFPDSARLLCSPGAADDIIRWVRTYTITDDFRVADATDRIDMTEITGPRAIDAVTALTGVDCSTVALCHWFDAQIGGIAVVVVRMPSADEVSFWLVYPRPHTETVRAALTEIPQRSHEHDEIMRIKAGMGRRGHEWTEQFNPLEAGLLHLTVFTKGCYIGQEVIARLDSYNKVTKRVMGLTSPTRLEQGSTLLVDGAVVGTVTSIAPEDHAPFHALTMIRMEHAHPESELDVQTSTSTVRATLHLLPMLT